MLADYRRGLTECGAVYETDLVRLGFFTLAIDCQAEPANVETGLGQFQLRVSGHPTAEYYFVVVHFLVVFSLMLLAKVRTSSSSFGYAEH